jgi:hypothetical protein
MRITEGFATTLADTLGSRIKDAEEDSRRLQRIIDPEQRMPGASPTFPLNGNWLNTIEQTATAALIQVTSLQQLLILVRDEAAKARREVEGNG